MEREGDRGDRPEVSAELATKHRAAVARVVFLAQDRLDLGVAAVDLAKTMAIPRGGANERLKRVARYLLGHMSRNTSLKLRRHCDVGKSSHRCDESGSTAHCLEFW